jgi:hypothetical protein
MVTGLVDIDRDGDVAWGSGVKGVVIACGLSVPDELWESLRSSGGREMWILLQR